MSASIASSHQADEPGVEGPVVRSIVVCATPDPDENAVTGLLERCGAGSPRPYFDITTTAPPLLAEWGVHDLDEYVDALHRERTTADGVFALVLHWHDLRRLHRQVAGLRQPTAQRILDVVRVIAPEPTFLRLSRARRTTPVADPSASAALERTRLDATDAVWTQWFDAIAVQPAAITYDDLAASDDPPATLATTLRACVDGA